MKPPAPDAARALARRRGVLLARSARLRDEIADDARTLRGHAGMLDRGASLARSGVLVPLAIAGGLLLAFGRPGRLLRYAGKALAFWPIVRPLVPRIAALLAARNR